MNFGFKPWETVDASTQGSVPPQRRNGERRAAGAGRDRSARADTQHLAGVFFQLALQHFADCSCREKVVVYKRPMVWF